MIHADGCVCFDWNAVVLHEPTDLVITPMTDTEMAKKKQLAFQ
jgi:hypothetical protein